MSICLNGYSQSPVGTRLHSWDEVEPRPKYSGRLNLPTYHKRGATSIERCGKPLIEGCWQRKQKKCKKNHSFTQRFDVSCIYI